MKLQVLIRKFIVALFLLAGVQLSAQAGSLQAGSSNDAFNVSINQNILGPLSFDASYTRNYQHSDELANAGLRLDFGLGPVGAEVGVKTFYADVGGQDGHGVAPGVGLSFSPLPMFTLSSNYYYSNADYSKGDIEHYRDWSVTANFHPIRFTNFFVGYGFQMVDTRLYGDTTLYDGMFAGVSVGF